MTRLTTTIPRPSCGLGCSLVRRCSSPTGCRVTCGSDEQWALLHVPPSSCSFSDPVAGVAADDERPPPALVVHAELAPVELVDSAGPRRSGRLAALDELTAETVDLLQTRIRNECVNDGGAGSGHEVRSVDVLQWCSSRQEDFEWRARGHFIAPPTGLAPRRAFVASKNSRRPRSFLPPLRFSILGR